jgi:hypothetical protein
LMLSKALSSKSRVINRCDFNWIQRSVIDSSFVDVAFEEELWYAIFVIASEEQRLGIVTDGFGRGDSNSYLHAVDVECLLLGIVTEGVGQMIPAPV